MKPTEEENQLLDKLLTPGQKVYHKGLKLIGECVNVGYVHKKNENGYEPTVFFIACDDPKSSGVWCLLEDLVILDNELGMELWV